MFSAEVFFDGVFSGEVQGLRRRRWPRLRFFFLGLVSPTFPPQDLYDRISRPGTRQTITADGTLDSPIIPRYQNRFLGTVSLRSLLETRQMKTRANPCRTSIQRSMRTPRAPVRGPGSAARISARDSRVNNLRPETFQRIIFRRRHHTRKCNPKIWMTVCS